MPLGRASRKLRISNRLWTLIWVSILISAGVVTLQLLKKRVFLVIDLQVSAASFRLEEDVPNFFSIENDLSGLKRISVASFSRIVYDSLKFNNEDAASSVDFIHANAAEILLEQNNVLTISADRKSPYAKVSISGYNQSISIVPNNDSLYFQGDLDGNGSSIFSSQPVKVAPLDGTIEVRFTADSELCVEEDEVFRISGFRATKSINGEASSSVLSGNVHISELKQDIPLSKNRRLTLGAEDEFTVTSLSICENRINIRMEGHADKLIIGDYDRNYIPSVLEFIYKNNYLIIFLNSFLAILNFILFMMKENKSEEK